MEFKYILAGVHRDRTQTAIVGAFCSILVAWLASTNLAAQDLVAPSTPEHAASPAVTEPAPQAPTSAEQPPSSPKPSDARAQTDAPGISNVQPEQQASPAASQQPEGSSPSDDGSEPDAPHANANLPHDLSPWKMFAAADNVVKSVMIGLVLASIATWTVWLSKSIELAMAKRRLTRAFSRINATASLANATQQLGGSKRQRGSRCLVSSFIDVATAELRLSADIPDKHGIKERVLSRLDGLAAAAGREMNRGTGLLATIGSTAPFIGLFGTVWGIMNSFIGISETQTTNLAVVAPGIAEALLATATGLVAAIPAVITYNQFARQIATYKAMIGDVSAEVMRLVSRDLDRGLTLTPAE